MEGRMSTRRVFRWLKVCAVITGALAATLSASERIIALVLQ
jgi:hypothetical protein